MHLRPTPMVWAKGRKKEENVLRALNYLTEKGDEIPTQMLYALTQI